MARVTYSDSEGVEHSLRLSEHHPVRIGRDPGNDLVLQDPKTSRNHAEIVFEKGFFVLHDLDSANGTIINGKRVRVAPLVDGMEISIGNRQLRFSEEVRELPAQTVAARKVQREEFPPSEPMSASRPAAAAVSGSARMQGAAAPSQAISPVTARETLEYPQIPASRPRQSAGASLPIGRPSAPASQPLTEMIPEQAEPTPERRATPRTEPQTAEPPPASPLHPSLENRRLFIDDLEADPEQLAVRNELDQPLVWFRSPRSAIILVAKVVATMVVVTGLAVTLFLIYERAWVPAVTAALITVSFAVMVGAAVPRRNIPVWSDASKSQLLVVARQERGLPFPTLRFLLQDSTGAMLGVVEKRVFPAAGRRVWRLCDADGERELVLAREDSLMRSLIGRAIGGSIRVLRTNYQFSSANSHVGTLLRAGGRPGRLLLELTSPPQSIDRRLLVTLALVIANTER